MFLAGPPGMLRVISRDWRLRPPAGTTFRGPLGAARFAVWAMWRSRGTLRLRVASIDPAPGGAVARVRATARRSGHRLDIPLTIAFSIASGRVRSMDEATDELAAWQAFWRR